MSIAQGSPSYLATKRSENTGTNSNQHRVVSKIIKTIPNRGKDKNVSKLLFLERDVLYLFVFCIAAIAVNFPVHAQDFGARQDMGIVQYEPIMEASGIAASRKNTDVLWTHNDSGDYKFIYAMNTQAEHLGLYNISGRFTFAYDWEDIAVGPGPIDGENYIYIGDFGDNYASRSRVYIHRVLEPNVSSTQTPIDTTLSDVESLIYVYPDGPRDAETLMVDPRTKDIYVVSKNSGYVHVYRLPYPQSTTETITAELVANFWFDSGRPVGGDIAKSGLEILIKSLSTVCYWSINSDQELWKAFENPPNVVEPYIIEPQGEAIAWASEAKGFYTISEESNGIAAHLYFYPRIDEPVSVESSAFNKGAINFELGQNYPNPFNPSTTIEFSLPKSLFVTLDIYNLMGEKITTLIAGQKSAGMHSVNWNARGLASGVYLYRLESKDYVSSKKLILMR